MREVRERNNLLRKWAHVGRTGKHIRSSADSVALAAVRNRKPKNTCLIGQDAVHSENGRHIHCSSPRPITSAVQTGIKA